MTNSYIHLLAVAGEDGQVAERGSTFRVLCDETNKNIAVTLEISKATCERCLALYSPAEDEFQRIIAEIPGACLSNLDIAIAGLKAVTERHDSILSQLDTATKALQGIANSRCDTWGCLCCGVDRSVAKTALKQLITSTPPEEETDA